MIKRVVVVSLIVVCFVAAVGLSYAADEKTPITRVMDRPAFSFLSGSLTKIDNTDPGNPAIEIKSDKDGSAHIIKITPYTNIIKVTDLSELKAGDAVRVMARSADGAESAMSVTFGKLRPSRLPPQSFAAGIKQPALPAAKK